MAPTGSPFFLWLMQTLISAIRNSVFLKVAVLIFTRYFSFLPYQKASSME